MNKVLALLVFLIVSLPVYSESVSTSLTDPAEVEKFHDVTTRIRCICLPSLPIKSCSYNNCAVSALLKQFIESRVRKGESANEIVSKLIYGYGDSASGDEVLAKFREAGNEYLVESIQNGFGEKLIAEPDSTWINITIGAGIFFGLGGIFVYLKGRLGKSPEKGKGGEISEDLKRYLKEIE